MTKETEKQIDSTSKKEEDKKKDVQKDEKGQPLTE